MKVTLDETSFRDEIPHVYCGVSAQHVLICCGLIHFALISLCALAEADVTTNLAILFVVTSSGCLAL